MTFEKHIRKIARKTAGKIAALRRHTWVLDPESLSMLYKAQIRPTMEYAPLMWGGAAPTHLNILDRQQARILRIIRDCDADHDPMLQSLQHRHDVSGLCVMHKTHCGNAPHLRPLRQPQRDVQRSTRAVEQAPQALTEPRCRTAHYARQFTPVYVKLWNSLLLHVTPEALTLQQFKRAANMLMLL